MFLDVSTAGGDLVRSKRLQCYLNHMSNTLCVGGQHLQLTCWKAVTRGWRKQRGDTVMARVQSLAKKSRSDGHSKLWLPRLFKCGLRWSIHVQIKQIKTSKVHSSSSGLCFITASAHNPPLPRLQYTYRDALPPSLFSHTQAHKEMRREPKPT